MQLQSIILAISALTTAVSAAFATTATWNDQLKVWDIGAVSSNPGNWAFERDGTPVAGRCGDVNFGEGDYACGSFKGRDVNALRAIYRCSHGWLELVETCHEDDKHAKDRCVKNGRRKGKKFFPFVDGKKVVCQKKSNVEKA
ncbi:hypothetical protein Q7P35_004861 [Cladosporium inversicolor]